MEAGVFLDRDGTLITETGYLCDPAGWNLVPGAADAVAAWNRAGLAVVLITNQSAVARGLLDEERLATIHAGLQAALEERGARLDLVLHCPHHPEIGEPPYRRVCTCRKPRPGMILAGAQRLGLDLARSWVVGDAERDLEAGRRAGVGNLVLVATGQGPRTHEALRARGVDDYRFAPDLHAAARLAAEGEAPDQGR